MRPRNLITPSPPLVESEEEEDEEEEAAIVSDAADTPRLVPRVSQFMFFSSFYKYTGINILVCVGGCVCVGAWVRVGVVFMCVGVYIIYSVSALNICSKVS